MGSGMSEAFLRGNEGFVQSLGKERKTFVRVVGIQFIAIGFQLVANGRTAADLAAIFGRMRGKIRTISYLTTLPFPSFYNCDEKRELVPNWQGNANWLFPLGVSLARVPIRGGANSFVGTNKTFSFVDQTNTHYGFISKTKITFGFSESPLTGNLVGLDPGVSRPVCLWDQKSSIEVIETPSAGSPSCYNISEGSILSGVSSIASGRIILSSSFEFISQPVTESDVGTIPAAPDILPFGFTASPQRLLERRWKTITTGFDASISDAVPVLAEGSIPPCCDLRPV